MSQLQGAARAEVVTRAARSMLRLYDRVISLSDEHETELVRSGIIAQADAMAGFASRLGAYASGAPDPKSSRLTPVASYLAERAGDIRAQAADMHKPFSILIAGMGKFGKSTLLNALAGAELAETDFLPNTWRIDVFDPTATRGPAKFVFRNGEVKTCPVEAARKAIDDEERKTAASKAAVERELAADYHRLQDAKARSERREQLRRLHQYVSPIVETHWPAPASGVLRWFRLVDTPGLCQDLLPSTIRASFEDYYYKADGVLWVIAADKITSSEPVQTMFALKSSLESAGAGSENIIAVLNKIDLVGPPGSAERDRAMEEANRVYGSMFREIIPLSAVEAYRAVTTGDEAAMESSGLNALLGAIDRRFRHRASRERRQHKAEMARAMVRLSSLEASRYRNLLELDYGTYSDLKNAFAEALRVARAGINADVGIAANEIRADIRCRAYAYGDHLWLHAGKSSLKGEIETTFALEKTVETMNRAAAALQQRLSEMCSVWARRSRMTEFQHLPEDLLSDTALPAISPAGVDLGRVTVRGLLEGVLYALSSMFSPLKAVFKPYVFHRFIEGVISACGTGLHSLETEVMRVADECEKKVRTCVDNVRDGSFESLHCRLKDVESVRKRLDEILGQQGAMETRVAVGHLLAKELRVHEYRRTNTAVAGLGYRHD